MKMRPPSRRIRAAFTPSGTGENPTTAVIPVSKNEDGPNLTGKENYVILDVRGDGQLAAASCPSSTNPGAGGARATT